jgi:putative SOS response-associated peptidase YedK
MGICEGLSRVRWKLSCTVLRGGTTGNSGSLLDRAIQGQKAKQPFAIAMKDGSPFAVAGIWESWEHPETKKIIRTFAIITTEANELVRTIHDRMPVIIAPADYHRWLSPIEPDPNDMMKPYPSEPMAIWPISTRVNSPENDSPDIRDPIDP